MYLAKPIIVTGFQALRILLEETSFPNAAASCFLSRADGGKDYYMQEKGRPVSSDMRDIHDLGPQPVAVNIDRYTKLNRNYRTALWTGKYLQVTLMSIPVGGDIGLEMHPNTDQFIRIEAGRGRVMMGDSPENLDYRANLNSDYAVMIPAGTWHNIINTGNVPLKLYSIYAPPKHPFGTVHKTKEDAAH